MTTRDQQPDDHLDDRFDGQTAPEARDALDEHVAAGADADAEERNLLALLRAYGADSAPAADPEFLRRALDHAVLTGAKRSRRRVWLKGFGSAIAAGLALFAITLTLLKEPEGGVPQVTMALYEPQTVHLVFASADELRDAQFTVTLPDGLELAGFEGEREIRWMTTLKAGKNVLPLRLVASSIEGGEVLATLEHEDDDRTFRLEVTVI